MIRFYERALPILVALFFAFIILWARSFACAGEEAVGDVCPTLGVSTMAADQQNLIACMKDKNGALVWKSMTGGQSGVPSGTIAFFALAGCPEGWALTDGNNKTVDLRGEFLRVWDAGKGVDSGRALGSRQGDAIRNITGKTYLANDGGSHHAMSRDPSGAFKMPETRTMYDATTDNRYTTGPFGVELDVSRVVPTANENRPRNIALLACQKL